MKFDFDDILLTPAVLSPINSRSEIDLFDENGMLPIFTAPMDTVVNNNNCKDFSCNKIYSILPRGKRTSQVSTDAQNWYSYGLDEFAEIFLQSPDLSADNKMYALLDVANGHMKKIHDLVYNAKKKYGDKLVLMTGNIANPKTFSQFDGLVDYIRCGIGGGSGCLTSVQTGVGYPMASLIQEIREIKTSKNHQTKIVADGGISSFADINKALALGADYVMLGGMLNKCLESAGELYEDNTSIGFYYDYKNLTKKTPHEIVASGVHKKYRGMSTKEVQREWGREKLKTAEGISKFNKVEYTLSQWAENMQDYLKSCMSYCGAKDLKSFIGKVEYENITPNSFKRFYK